LKASGEPGSDRQTLPIKVVLQNGCLFTGCPGATTMRSLAQSAFVDEDQDTPLPERFFFSAGHTFFFQCRICSSLRSRARPSGRCGLQPRPTTFKTFLKDVETALLTDLKSHQVRQEIQAEAKRFEKEIFPAPKLTADMLRAKRFPYLNV
jgi:hypothetical protein